MGSVWEIDFYSRPILDENQKKIWEVLVCESPIDTRADPDSLFRYAKFCPSTQVNSGWLRTALTEAIEKSGVTPVKFRFFRNQMNNMISKACGDLGIPAQVSRRTLVLRQWLQQRMQEVYPQEPGYQPMPNPSVRIESLAPQRLPSALTGQQWVFVSLEAATLAEMHEWDIAFGDAFPLQIVNLAPETKVPGVIIFSATRAVPLAGWMSGLEIAFLKYSQAPVERLLLETGAVDSWILANLKPQTIAEAAGFEAAKQKAKGVHFLAVQSDPQAESFAGFWLLQELDLL